MIDSLALVPHLRESGSVVDVGSGGGFPGLADLLWNRARTLVFSTGLTIGTQAAALAGVAIARSAEGAERRSRVCELGRSLRFELGCGAGADSPIVPVILGDDRRAVAAARRLEELGYWVPAIRPPTVAEGSSRLRVTLSAMHSDEQIDGLRAALAGVV